MSVFDNRPDPDDQEKGSMEHLSQVQADYADELMRKAHVVGVGVGLKRINGEYTDILCLVVMVDEKLPLSQLAEEDVVPAEIDGELTDVQETGTFSAQ